MDNSIDEIKRLKQAASLLIEQVNYCLDHWNGQLLEAKCPKEYPDKQLLIREAEATLNRVSQVLGTDSLMGMYISEFGKTELVLGERKDTSDEVQRLREEIAAKKREFRILQEAANNKIEKLNLQIDAMFNNAESSEGSANIYINKCIELDKKLDVAKKALEFYAEENNWNENTRNVNCESDVSVDHGNTARMAIGEIL